MRFPAITTAAFAALIAAGCGGTQGTGAGASDIVPASAPVFIQIDTDPGSAQWKQADALLSKFPGRDRLIGAIEKALNGQGVSYEQDIKLHHGPSDWSLRWPMRFHMQFPCG